jgi:hypothetical protein
LRALAESVLREGRQRGVRGQSPVEEFDLPAPGIGVLPGEGCVAALQGLALGMVAESFEGSLADPLAQGLGRVVDAGDVFHGQAARAATEITA